MGKRLLDYVLARAQERSSVAGVVAVVSTIVGVALPDTVAPAVVAIAGLLAAFIPGGK